MRRKSGAQPECRVHGPCACARQPEYVSIISPQCCFSQTLQGRTSPLPLLRPPPGSAPGLSLPLLPRRSSLIRRCGRRAPRRSRHRNHRETSHQSEARATLEEEREPHLASRTGRSALARSRSRLALSLTAYCTHHQRSAAQRSAAPATDETQLLTASTIPAALRCCERRDAGADIFESQLPAKRASHAPRGANVSLPLSHQHEQSSSPASSPPFHHRANP